MAIVPTAVRPSSPPSQAAPARAFSTQFLSLVLIILTFIIGVFASHQIRTDSHAPGPEETQSSPKNFQIGAMSWQSLFDPGTATMREEVVDSLAAVLNAHDIRAILTVYGSDAEHKDYQLELALERASALYHYLRAQRVPAQALDVAAVEVQSTTQASVNFEHGGVDEKS